MSILLEGQVARDLAVLARERWQQAGCNKEIKTIDATNDKTSPRPDYIKPMFKDIRVAITRTWIRENKKITIPS